MSPLLKSHIVLIVLAISGCFARSLTAQQNPIAQLTDVGPLVAILDSDTPVFDKAIACRRLALIGDETAVTALSKLLGDERLGTYARSALEAIPADASAKALRDALEKLQGPLLIGAVNSLGRLRDAKAIDSLHSLLKNEESQVALAAARALGSIGTLESVVALVDVDTSHSHDLTTAVGWAILTAAGHLAQSGDPMTAVDLYDRVANSGGPQSLQLAAKQRAIAVLGEAGRGRLSKLLSSADDAEFRAGIFVARKSGSVASDPLMAAYTDAPVDRQSLLLNAIGALGEVDSLGILLKATASDEVDVRREAYLALGRQTSPQVAAALLAGMSDEVDSVATAARDALAGLQGAEVDQTIADILNRQAADLLGSAIEVAQQRQLAAATPALLVLVDSSNTDIGVQAMEALGSTIELKELPRILDRMLESKGEQRTAAVKALGAAYSRLPREACAETLAGAVPTASLENQVLLLEQLTLLGGETALRIVAGAARSPNDALQDAATRLLGEWPTSDVAGPLVELASDPAQRKYRIRVLRGYLRVARQLDMPIEERITVCARTLQLADRPVEQQLALDVLKRYPTPSAVVLASSQISNQALGNAGFETVLDLSKGLLEKRPDDLAEALQLTLDRAATDRQRQQVLELLTSARRLGRQKEQEAGFVLLFDGKSLAGWHGNTDIFRVADGQIVGGNLDNRVQRNEFLRTDQKYGDFELRLQAKLLGESPNAGVQIRTQEIPDDHEVSGYQADMGPNWWGCLYDESRRRRVLAGPAADQRDEPVRKNEWNDYRILCEGPRIRLWVNGVPTVDYTEEDGAIPLEGIIAVQVHAGAPMEARYRNLRIREIK